MKNEPLNLLILYLLAFIVIITFVKAWFFTPKPVLSPQPESVVTTCHDAGGQAQWIVWEQGCTDKEGNKLKCFTEMCIVPYQP